MNWQLNDTFEKECSGFLPIFFTLYMCVQKSTAIFLVNIDGLNTWMCFQQAVDAVR